MPGVFAGQGAVGQVTDHSCVQAQVEQGFARFFEAGVLAQKLIIGAVGQVEQGQATDLLLDEGHAGQGAWPAFLRIFAAHGQVRRQQHDALAADRVTLAATGVDGELQHLQARGADLLLQHGGFALQLEHQAPGFAQAFASMFVAEGRSARRSQERVADQRFIFPGQVQLSDHFAQPGLGDPVFEFLAFRLVIGSDLDLHEGQSPPQRLIDIALRQFGERQPASLRAGDQYVLLRRPRGGTVAQDFLPMGGVGQVQRHLDVLRQAEVLTQACVDGFFAEGLPRWQLAFKQFMGTLHRCDAGREQPLELRALSIGECAEPLRQAIGQATAVALFQPLREGQFPGGRNRHGQASECLLAQVIHLHGALVCMGRNGVLGDQLRGLLFTAVELALQGVFKRVDAQR
ncbi:hypothetical protein D3C72_426800 [compost metagenome]